MNMHSAWSFCVFIRGERGEENRVWLHGVCVCEVRNQGGKSEEESQVKQPEWQVFLSVNVSLCYKSAACLQSSSRAELHGACPAENEFIHLKGQFR